MSTECSAPGYLFPLGRRRVEARFDGGAISSDGGALLLSATERRTGILQRFAACFTDHGDPTRISHTATELVSPRVYGLALGYEDLVDHDYVEQYTVGYDDLQERAAQFPPDTVAEITGIAADDIRTLAREFATTQPSVVRMGVAIERHAGGGNAVRAMSCLPALVGSWRHLGGGVLHMPIWAFPVKWDDLSRPDWIRAGTPVINSWRLGPALAGELESKLAARGAENRAART